jgi:hypothetical protein
MFGTHLNLWAFSKGWCLRHYIRYCLCLKVNPLFSFDDSCMSLVISNSSLLSLYRILNIIVWKDLNFFDQQKSDYVHESTIWEKRSVSEKDVLPEKNIFESQIQIVIFIYRHTSTDCERNQIKIYIGRFQVQFN